GALFFWSSWMLGWASPPRSAAEVADWPDAVSAWDAVGSGAPVGDSATPPPCRQPLAGRAGARPALRAAAPQPTTPISASITFFFRPRGRPGGPNPRRCLPVGRLAGTLAANVIPHHTATYAPSPG